MDKITVDFTRKTPKNHSTRWDADDKDAAMSAVYIRKPFTSTARKIRVTIEEVE